VSGARTKATSHESSLRIVRFAVGGRKFAALVEDGVPRPLSSAVTPAERDVAGWLRRGLSNREIAQKRGTSLRTVANQIASLMRKLGADSRVQLALRVDAEPLHRSSRSRAAK
jgi:DNA-binding NarL/FixJ family response regulator